MARFFFRFFMAIGTYLYKISGGKIGGRLPGLEVLLLTTTGRKTGRKRTTPLGYFEDQGSFIIIGSNAGFDTHPAWFYNLKSQPRVTIQVKDKQLQVNAEVAGPDERNQLWTKLVELAPFYGNYAKKTSREIPMVILHPVPVSLKMTKGEMDDMSVFTKNELDYIGEQKLGRLATVDMDGNPHVVPVGFRHNPETDTIEIGGHNIALTRKWRDMEGHPRVAIEILADAELLESGGEGFGRGLDPQIIRLQPVKIIAWGIDEKKQSRKVNALRIKVSGNQKHVIV